VNFNAYTPPGWWDRTRFLRYAFVAGLVVGVFMGWFFHGLISMVLQFGFVAILLLPLIVLTFMWWRSSREQRRVQSSMTVMRWSPGQYPPQFNEAFEQDVPNGPFGRRRANDEILDVDGHQRQEQRR
jgi:hypothetical protein